MTNRKRSQSQNAAMGVLAVFLTIIILAACTIGGLQLWGRGNVKPSNWFKDDVTIPVGAEDVKYNTTLPTNGGMTIAEKVEDGETDEKGTLKSNGITVGITDIEFEDSRNLFF